MSSEWRRECAQRCHVMMTSIKWCERWTRTVSTTSKLLMGLARLNRFHPLRRSLFTLSDATFHPLQCNFSHQRWTFSPSSTQLFTLFDALFHPSTWLKTPSRPLPTTRKHPKIASKQAKIPPKTAKIPSKTAQNRAKNHPKTHFYPKNAHNRSFSFWHSDFA